MQVAAGQPQHAGGGIVNRPGDGVVRRRLQADGDQLEARPVAVLEQAGADLAYAVVVQKGGDDADLDASVRGLPIGDPAALARSGKGGLGVDLRDRAIDVRIRQAVVSQREIGRRKAQGIAGA